MVKKLQTKRRTRRKRKAKVKWYSVSNGELKIPVQGKWEKRVAEWLTQSKIFWIRKAICFCKTRTYTPDFYLPEHDVFIEVKGWWRDRDKYKMFLALRENKVQIRILDKRHIEKLDKIELADLPFFNDEFKFRDIDRSKFKDVWMR